jgi:DNA polymerase (family 10)
VDNADVAAVFLEMGELLSIQGGDLYRSRAFRTTARILEDLTTPVGELLLLNRLTSIRGIGAGSVERIQQILQTGTCSDHQKLLQRLPTGLREVLHVRGMGPRHARLAFEMLGVSNRDQLEWVARNGMLRALPGVGDKTVERVLSHLDELKLGPPPRLLLRDALVLGATLVDWLKEEPAVVRVEQTGSARRRKETVGDLDILVATASPRPCVQRFLTFPGVKEVLLAGDSRASVVLEPVAGRGAMQADLRVVVVESFGAGQHYFTGSKQHNIQVRLRANAKKLAVSEHGVWERKLFGRNHGDENRKIARRITAGTFESDIFSAVNLPLIVPELREGDGEIEAADAGKLPRLVELSDLKGDLGLHARTAADAGLLLAAQKARGHTYGTWIRPLHEVDDVDAFVSDARALEDRLHLRVFCGVQLLIDKSGTVSVPKAMRDAVDVVVAVAQPLLDVFDLDKQAQSARLLKALSSGSVDVLSHATGRRLLVQDGADIDLHTVLLSAARSHVAVEVSGDPRRLDLDARGCRADRDAGALLSLTSSATTVEETALLQQAVWQARRGWVESALVLNTRSADDVDAWLSDRRPRKPKTRKLGGWVVPVLPADDALSLALAAKPLSDEMRARLEALLHGDDDDDLRRSLERDGGNALQKAFALLV